MLAILISMMGLGSVSSGGAAGTDMPGPCYGIDVNAVQDSIMVSGTVPDNYDTAAVKGIHIYRGTSADGLTFLSTLKVYTNTARFFLYQDTSIANGVTYFYAVAAFNELGEGERSEIFNATSVGAPPAPQGMTASVTYSYVHLSWSPPASDGGSPVIYYGVFRGLRGCEPSLIANVTGLSYDDLNVAFNDSFYNYQVCAVNEYGAGKRSMTVFASLPMPVVSGRLTGTDGGPLVGADLEVDSNGTVACTDSNGTFSIAMTPGSHTLTVWVDGNVVHRIDLVIPIGSTDLGEIRITKHGGAGIGLETVALTGVIALVTTGMVVWAMGKAKIK